MYTIYIHRFPNNKVYVGCTAQRLDWRFGRNGEGYKDAAKIWAAIQQFGWENVQHEVLATAESRFEASRLEQYYIDYYQSANDEYGYNTRKGGLGKPMPPMTPEQCLKIRRGKTGKIGIHKPGENRYVSPEEVGAYLAQGWERGGEPLPEAMKRHLSEINTGKKYSDETKKKLSEIRKGTILVHKEENNRRVRPEELDSYLSAGWEKGASPDWVEINRQAQTGKTQSAETRQKRANSLLGKNVGRKHIHNGIEHKMVKADEIEFYLAQGWKLGKPKL